MRALPSFTASLWFASALGLFIGCSSSSPDSGGPSASDDAAATMGDAPSCAADATATSCCCAGDVQEAPVCSAAGTLSCGTGYGLYHGADCSCSTGAQNTLDAGDASDADVCPAPNVLRYETAGCGDSAHPVCGRSDQDACAIAVCGCDGTTLVKCDYASTPWSHLGACTGDDAAAGCSVTNTSSLTGVSLAFRAPIGCTFTLAQAAAGITIPYDVVVASDVTGVTPAPADDGGCGAPGSSGLITFEQLAGGGQSYCLCDTGLCPRGPLPTVTLNAGTYANTFSWSGRNWSGPSDVSNPMGAAFPAGDYPLTVSAKGTHGGTNFVVTATLTIHLTPP